MKSVRTRRRNFIYSKIKLYQIILKRKYTTNILCNVKINIHVHLIMDKQSKFSSVSLYIQNNLTIKQYR